MPVISMFYGIIISMFAGSQVHNPPHFHAKFGEYNAVFSLDGELLNGDFPPKKIKMVQVWADIHHDELIADWEISRANSLPYKIEPLK